MIMKKPWSITTTLRNPDRLRSFLVVLQQLENSEWNYANQRKYQTLLIQNRVYGYGKSQFYNDLTQEQIKLVNNQSEKISYAQAEDIFNTKAYEDPAMRGRQSINPLKKIGLVVTEANKVKITNLGKLFLKENFELGEIFFRSFLKWQIPNPASRDYPANGAYNIKPFIGTLQLIRKVNQKEIARGNAAKGISKKEFSLFAPTLVHYQNIDLYAEKIIKIRSELSGKPQQKQKEIFTAHKKQFAHEFLNSNDEAEVNKLLKNLQDYGDNAIRYFRLTKYIYIRGGGFYIDLEARRLIELNSLLNKDHAQSKSFTSKEDYLTYISDISKPELPWETRASYTKIIKNLVRELQKYERALQKEHRAIKDLQTMQNAELKAYITELRTYQRVLQDAENHKKSQAIKQLNACIQDLGNIFNFKNRPLLLEKLSTFGLYALNDALKIQPNYPVGDDNEPIFTAPANKPDIECFYESFYAICEVTMLRSRDQWYYEGQPVMRHLRDFEQTHKNKPAYCLFIAPKLHRDTVNTFWNAIKHGYEGGQQKIIPLSIAQFISVLEALVAMKAHGRFLQHTEISCLYDKIVNSSSSYQDSNTWLQNIPTIISAWTKRISA